MISFPCPKCGFTLKAPEEKMGARSKCLKCGCPVQVPAPMPKQNVVEVPPANAPVSDRALVVKQEEILDVLPADDVPVRSSRNRRRRRPRSSNNQLRHYEASGLHLSKLCRDLEDWLYSEGFDTQNLEVEEGATLIQIRQQGGWRKLVGMETALNIVLDKSDDELTVEIGAGQWVDKLAVGAVGMFIILWPLAITAAIGAWNQVKMPERIFGWVDDFIYRENRRTRRGDSNRSR